MEQLQGFGSYTLCSTRELWPALLYPAGSFFETFFLETETEIITSQLLSF